MKISIKIFVAIVLGIINYNVNAQTVSTDCENYRSGNTPSTIENIACDRANCWGFGAIGFTNTSGQIISGSANYSGKVFMIIRDTVVQSFWALEISPTLEFN
jgi:hypothetical protein